MDEAEQLSDRIVVISAGKVVARGTADELAEQVQASTIISWDAKSGDVLPSQSLGWTMNDVLNRLEISTTDVLPVLNELTSWAIDTNVELQGLNVSRPTLEDVYLSLTDGAETDA